MGRPLIDITGRKYNMLTVIGLDEELSTKDRKWWICQCECGNIKSLLLSDIKCKRRISCGCFLRTKHMTHGCTNTRLYNVWNTMKQRCYNPKNLNYKEYGARGIDICDDWHFNFMNFKKWSEANGYDAEARRGECTIDRIDNSKGYSPDNCRWVSMKIQASNKRRPNNWKPIS